MLSPSFITDWLQHPRPLTPAEQEAVDTLLREYPYFLPAHYMDAAEQYRKNPSPSPLQAMMQLYLGNWAFFHGMLQAAQHAADETLAPAGAPDNHEDDVLPAPANPLPDAGPDFAPEGLEAMVLETHHHETSGLSNEDEAALNAPVDVVPDFLQQDWGDAAEFEEPENAEVEHTEADEPETLAVEDLHPEPAEPESVLQQDEASSNDVIQPLYTEDYFRYEGVAVPDSLPPTEPEPEPVPGGDLMVMRSFSDWLLHFRTKKEEALEEAEGRKALKAHWQKEKLAAALEEEDDEIPEAVFEMAVSSITQDEPLVSESMASVYLKQGKLDKAIEVYRRLQSANPAKSSYFAAKIAAVEQQKSTWSS